MPIYFKIKDPSFLWGDYGAALFHGLNANEPMEPKFPVKLQRTGPYVPDFTRPWGYIVVTDALKQKLERTSFKGIAFAEVELDKIVKLDWHTWDRRNPEPEKWPAGGEPENYIQRRKHNENVASQIPKLWALDVPEVKPPLTRQSLLESNVDPNTDIFECGWSFHVTPNLRLWLLDTVPECLSFSFPVMLFEREKTPDQLEYFRLEWNETRGDQFDHWGKSTWYFEVGDDNWAVRHIERYANGNSLKYPGDPLRSCLEDEHGGLASAPFDEEAREQMELTKISASEFEEVWNESGLIDGEYQWWIEGHNKKMGRE